MNSEQARCLTNCGELFEPARLRSSPEDTDETPPLIGLTHALAALAGGVITACTRSMVTTLRVGYANRPAAPGTGPRIGCPRRPVAETLRRYNPASPVDENLVREKITHFRPGNFIKEYVFFANERKFDWRGGEQIHLLPILGELPIGENFLTRGLRSMVDMVLRCSGFAVFPISAQCGAESSRVAPSYAQTEAPGPAALRLPEKSGLAGVRRCSLVMMVTMAMRVLHRCTAVRCLVYRRRCSLLDHRCRCHRCTLRGHHLGIRRLRERCEGKQTCQRGNCDFLFHEGPRYWINVGLMCPRCQNGPCHAPVDVVRRRPTTYDNC